MPAALAGAVVDAALEAAAGHHHRECVRVMVATDVGVFHVVAVFAHRGAVEFAAPYDERMVQQAALLEVLNQCLQWLV